MFHKILNYSYKVKWLIICLLVFAGQIVLLLNVYALPTISVFTCPTSPNKTTHDGINKTTFQYNCAITVNRDGLKKLQVGIYATSANPAKVSGNGTQVINITSPQDRFTVYGTKQKKTTGVPAAITTTSSFPGITIVKDNIKTDNAADFTFKIYFDVFDADKATNTFQQHYRMALFSETGTLYDEYPANPGTNYAEFTVPEIISLSATPSPVMTFDTASEIFAGNSHYEESDQDVTITIAANNTWVLEEKIDAKLNNGTDDIIGKKIWFECHAGTGYTCFYGADIRTQFPGQGGAAKYIEIAKDPDNTAGDYTTGSSDSMTLNTLDVTMTHFVRNMRPTYQPGNYTSTTSFRITTPRP